MSYLNLDFKSPKQYVKRRKNRVLNRLILLIAGIISFAFIIIWLLPDSDDTPAITPSVKSDLGIKPQVMRRITSFDIPDQFQNNAAIVTPIDKASQTVTTRSSTIKQGDSLSAIFNKQGISASVLHKIMVDAKDSKLLKKIRSGQSFDFIFNQDDELVQLLYYPDITQTYQFTKDDNGKFKSSTLTNPLEATPVYKEGTIISSLFLAAANSDIPDTIIMNMVAIFGWDIDFALDIRKGDSFKLIYNELYQDGKKIKTGRILAAEFTNRSKTFQAIFYTDPTGRSNYYSPNGKSMRKAFLRNPIKFSRISSRFTTKRWHPVLSKWRSHKGVDYAARRGTPIYAAGDGKIIHAGTKGGYGRTIIIQHGGKYTTLYAHLNGYNKNTRRGKRVKQGQTIGYVGSSGLATGPHLHYEFRVSGAHRNPLTVKLPAAKPINKKYKADFDTTKDKRLNMLKIMGNA